MYPFVSSVIAALCNTQKRLSSSTLAKIYTVRAVLLLNISTVIAQGFFSADEGHADPNVYGACSFSVVHHLVQLVLLYPLRITWVVFVIDLLLLFAEFVWFCFMLLVYSEPTVSVLWPFLAGNAVALLFSLYFRGESRAIALIRGIVLVSLCITIPAVGGYFSLVAPIRATIMTRNIKVARPWYTSGLAGEVENVTMSLFYVSSNYEQPLINLMVTRTVGGNLDVTPGVNIELLAGTPGDPTVKTVVCPYSWLDLAFYMDDLIVSVSPSENPGILYVKTGQGDPSDINSYAEAIPLKAGSHLSAILSRKRRDLFSKNAQDILGFTTPLRSITVNSVLLVQTDPSPPDLNLTSLRLHMREDMGADPAEILQDYSDASVLNGLATFGGFWTFVNGAFAMVFGANLLYFLFRRRSLSALGIVHIFQRRALTRKWNEDFPALHTEGGHPGSKSAGIVAFLRERLVDLDDEEDHSGDLEA
ncbi:hypothetical protein MVEN_00775900 [Mycena venus]|uniref:Uncharacterized protein n=1 Tax=Mycena venus TaxID=2733690 RepID=A0A8H6YM79_9AGAR|nr:hypothetical protein MVEN_00775900 [Mycena venus]